MMKRPVLFLSLIFLISVLISCNTKKQKDANTEQNSVEVSVPEESKDYIVKCECMDCEDFVKLVWDEDLMSLLFRIKDKEGNIPINNCEKRDLEMSRTSYTQEYIFFNNEII